LCGGPRPPVHSLSGGPRPPVHSLRSQISQSRILKKDTNTCGNNVKLSGCNLHIGPTGNHNHNLSLQVFFKFIARKIKKNQPKLLSELRIGTTKNRLKRYFVFYINTLRAVWLANVSIFWPCAGETLISNIIIYNTGQLWGPLKLLIQVSGGPPLKCKDSCSIEHVEYA